MNGLEQYGIETGQGRHHEEAFYGLALVYTLLFNKMAKYLDEYDLTPAKMNVLMILKHHAGKEGLSQKDLGGRLMVTASNMTRLLDKLAREKLIEYSAREGDKRVKVIRVTQRGSYVLDEVWPGYRKTMKEAMNKVSLKQQKIIADVMLNWFKVLKD